jgi:glycerate kinase
MKHPRLTIAIAPDSFKGALSAAHVAEVLADGLRAGLPGARFRLIPMADGGEGTVDAWASATGARRCRARVHDPLGRPILAGYACDDRRRAAVIEMAAASGLPLLADVERNPLLTSTRGTGELIRHALDHGARRILVGIGGSATNDGGTGMAAALGVRFLDRNGRVLPPGGGALLRLHRIDDAGLDPRLRYTALDVACDVTNPLCGRNGASAVYGPQKGATSAQVRRLDAGLARLAAAVGAARPDLADLAEAAGAGAAGGLGYGLMAFCGARLGSGVERVAAAVRLDQRLRGCDLVITGEGRLDGQTVNGKTPVGVAAVARRLGIPVIAICGCLGDGYEAVHAAGIEAVFPVAHGIFDPRNPARGARARIRACAVEVGRLLAVMAVRVMGQ